MKISYSGFFLDSTGYGEAARRFVWALRSAGADVRCGEGFSDGGPRVIPEPWLREFLETGHDRPDLHILHAIAADYPMIRVRYPAACTVGFTCWETSELPQAMVDGCKSVDRICVPSRHNATVFAQAGIQTSIIPYPRDDEMDMVPIPALESLKQAHILYTIGTRQPRKNLRGTLIAMMTAGYGNPNVAVVVKTGRSALAIAAVELEVCDVRRDLNMPVPPVVVIGEASQAQIRWLHRVKGTCYVTLSRGEGFALPVLDALAAGCEVVTSRWGGVADLLTVPPTDVPRFGVWAVPSQMTPVCQDYPLFSGVQYWAEPDVYKAKLALDQVVSARPRHYVRNLSDYDALRIGQRLLEEAAQWISGADMDIGHLTPALDLETGRTLEDPDLQALLIVATGTFNAWSPQAVNLSGTTFDRELNPREQRLIVLFATALHMRGQHLNAVMVGVIHTNVAGRTDLSHIPKNIMALRSALADEIMSVLTELSGGSAAVSGIQVHELGRTLGIGFGLYRAPWPYWIG